MYEPPTYLCTRSIESLPSPASGNPHSYVSADGGKGKCYPFPLPALAYKRRSQLAGLITALFFSQCVCVCVCVVGVDPLLTLMSTATMHKCTYIPCAPCITMICYSLPRQCTVCSLNQCNLSVCVCAFKWLVRVCELCYYSFFPKV